MIETCEHKIGSTQEFQDFLEELRAEGVRFEQLALQHYRLKSELALLKKTIKGDLERVDRIIKGVAKNVDDWPSGYVRWIDKTLCGTCIHCHAPDGAVSTGFIVCRGEDAKRPRKRSTVPLSDSCPWFEVETRSKRVDAEFLLGLYRELLGKARERIQKRLDAETLIAIEQHTTAQKAKEQEDEKRYHEFCGESNLDSIRGVWSKSQDRTTPEGRVRVDKGKTTGSSKS